MTRWQRPHRRGVAGEVHAGKLRAGFPLIDTPTTSFNITTDAMVRPGKQKRTIGTVMKRYFPQTQRILTSIASSIGLASHERQRTVRFQSQAAVFEFERQLLGGGGVPDGDAVALGLGPRCACALSLQRAA